jgi:hypothetical protein
MLRLGGKYTLTIVDNQARTTCGGPLEPPEGQTEYTFYVPGYGNVDLSSQEAQAPGTCYPNPKEYVDLSDADYLFKHVLHIPGFDIFDLFENYVNELTRDLAICISNVDASPEEPPEDSLDLADVDYIIKYVLDVPGFEEFPAATQACCNLAPGLQAPQADDIVLSIGELETPGDCDSVIHPLVIYPPKVDDEFQSRTVPINICNLNGRKIDTVEIRIQLVDPTVAFPTDASAAYVSAGGIVPDGWNPPQINTVGDTYIIGLVAGNNPGINEDGSISHGTILNVTFTAEQDNIEAQTPVKFIKAKLKDTVGGAQPIEHTVRVVDNEIALPVKLSALGAMWNPDGGIRVFWEAESQRENLGWNVYRSETEDGKYVKINGDLIKGAGTTANPMKYDFVDEDAISGKSFYYLENISFDGEKYRSHIIEAILVNQLSSWGAIKNSSLRQTPLASHGTQKPIVFVKIYDAKGNLIKNLKKKK